jgi:hypothetical protein
MSGALGRSAFVAALFAVHPLHVESVAWVTERKDVLSTLFAMLAIWAYVRYVRVPRLTRYVVVVLFSILGLMAKPMLVTLPFVLLLLDLWPLCRLEIGKLREQSPTAVKLIWEKLPLVVVSIAASIVTIAAQGQGGAVAGTESVPWSLRFTNAPVSYAAYIVTMLWPTRLAALYPFVPLPGWWVGGAVLALAGISVLVIRAARRRQYLVVGWFWYVGTLVPVIGLIQAGYQSRADRFTYVPLIGLFIMVAWGIVDLVGRWRYRGLMLGAAAALVIVACAITARMQTGYWRSDRALWEHCLEVTNLNYVAEAKLGKALADERQAAAAGVHYSAALRINPNIPEVHNELGILLAEAGKLEEAVGHYREAVRLKPDYAEAHDNIGVALASQGRVDEAIREFQTALKIRPDFMDARKNLAVALREREE